MMNENSLFYTLALQNVEGVGDITAKKLLSYFGDAESVLKATREELIRIAGIGDKLLTNLREKNIFDAAENEMRRIQKQGVFVSYYKDESYPELLKHCDDGPVLLFSSKPAEWNNSKIISIVGTRNITAHGRKFCKNLIRDIAEYNPLIISGFAYGTDVTAHLTAIENNLKTVAVLGNGLTNIYPKEHIRYITAMERSGGFLTEFWMSKPIDKENFIRRNRIIAGISQATIIIESAEKGGSMSTAGFGNAYDREVFALPGRYSDRYSQGCNELIKTQKAQLITSGNDLIEMLGWNKKNKDKSVVQKKMFIELSDDEQKIYDYLSNAGKEQMDLIAMYCEIPIHKLSTHLLKMELKGAIRPLPGKIFEAI